MKNLVYRISANFFLTSGLTRRIEHRISLLYPASRYSVIKMSEKYLIKVYLAALLAVAGLLAFAEISLYYGCLVTMVVYVMVNSFINTELGRQEEKLLKLFEEFISEVHFHYQFDGMLYEAVEKAIEKVPYEMSIHGQLILSYLKNAYLGKGDDYREISPNNLFLTFYSLSFTVLTYGDKNDDTGSIYLKNLSYLKEDVNVEILKRRKLSSQFIGLSLVTILPVFSIKFIEAWAVSNMPELRSRYEGFSGIITTVILILMTIGIYKIISILKNPFHTRECKSKWTEKLLQIYFVDETVFFLIRKTYKSSEKLNYLLKSIVYPYDIKEFILRRIVFSGITMTVVFVVELSIGLEIGISILISFLSAVVCYMFLYAKILVKRQIMIMDSEEEIVRFQSVILMLMHMDRITIEQVLNQISDFAVIFKEEVEGMINKFSYLGMKVFEDVKENTGFMPLEKLMDGFIASDMLGIESAFSGMETDRRYYVEKHKQENEEIVAKKAVIAKGLAFIPICAIIIVKLILPFVMEGMNQLTNTGL